MSTAHLLAALHQSDPGVAAVCGRLGLREVALVAELVFVDERYGGVDTAIGRAQKLSVMMGMQRMLPMHLLHVLALEPQSASNRILSRLDQSPERLADAALDALDSMHPALHPDPAEVVTAPLVALAPLPAPARTPPPPDRKRPARMPSPSARMPPPPPSARRPPPPPSARRPPPPPPARRPPPPPPARIPPPPPPPPAWTPAEERPAAAQPSRVASLALDYQREHARANALWLGDEVEARLQAGRSRDVRTPVTFADEVEAKLRRRS